MSSTSRMLTLLSLLQTRRDWPGGLLAERLEVSPRTVRRDVDRLRELGYRIGAVKGPDGGYRLDAGSELPPLLFDDDQAIALAVALQHATAAGAGVEEAAVRALTTVRQVLPARLRHRLDALRFTTLEPRAPDARPTDPELLITLSTAVRARQVLRVDHVKPGAAVEQDPPPPRRVEPHHLVASAGRWYLVAWDLDRDDWRIFRADRLVPRTPAGTRFAPRAVPGGDVRAFVAARFKGSAARDEWPSRGSVVLERPAEEVRPFVGDDVVTPLDGGRVRVEAGAWSWPALAASFARFDAAISEVEPGELRAAFGELAARAAVASKPRSK
ncbi:helix-turn-helix transcriptional regulator [Herbiconiux flava]|uniref:Putative DNA-binding transcriptional regulator YafY n=1 Tax=Herbiconiux flava TaxID=881268 RepID=A0A852SAK6_9MICO|nr:WYL domain-containing protein [Herbiconiux flava]NYD69366.1 putative DNA-binding transcriptional regulator YafY [Herbiconiux flava]